MKITRMDWFVLGSMFFALFTRPVDAGIGALFGLMICVIIYCRGGYANQRLY